MKLWNALALSITLLISSSCADARHGAIVPVGWQQVKIGAGGFVTAMFIAPDGTRFARTDTSGAYVWNAATSNWDQVNVKGRMPVGDTTIACADGAYAIAIAPNLTSRLYMYTGNPSCYGYIFRSNDRGLTWTRTGFASHPAEPNDQGQPNARLNSPYMAVDPQNADIVYTSTPSSGLFKSTDGGTTWAQVTAVGTATTPVGANMGLGHLIVFDPTSTVVGTGCTTPGNCVTQGIYVSTYGTGVYHTTTGGPLASGWTLTTSTPTTHIAMRIGSDGVVWFINNDIPGAGSLLRYNGTWSTQISSGVTQLTGVAVDPTNPLHVYANSLDGKLLFTLNGTTPYTGPTAVARASPQIPWLASANATTEAFSVLAFDPSQVNTLYNASGVGVWKTNPPTTNTTVTWTTETAGIESLATTLITSVPSGPMLLMSFDRPLWEVTNPNTYQSTYYPNGNTGNIDPGWTADYAVGTSTLVETSTIQNGQISGNTGTSWAAFTTQPSPAGTSAVGGNLAAASATNIVWLLSDDAGPYFSNDGGVTWATCTITGGSVTGGGWHHAQFSMRTALTVDRVNPTTYYLYNDGSGTNTEGVYKSTNGQTFTLQASSTGQLGLFTAGSFKMIAVPGKAGQLFAEAGADPHSALPNGLLFYKSIDGGAHWASIPNVQSVFAHGYGKAKPGGSGDPAIYLLGYVDLQDGQGYKYGMFRSDDYAATWTNIGDGYPLGIFDSPNYISGDMNNYGRVYLGWNGTGYVFRDLN